MDILTIMAIFVVVITLPLNALLIRLGMTKEFASYLTLFIDAILLVAGRIINDRKD